MKIETLEEAAEKWYDSTEENKDFPKIKAFKDGAKWQQEQFKQETLEEDFKIWDDLFGILAWKFKPTKSGDMYLDGEKVYEELKSKFKLKRL